MTVRLLITNAAKFAVAAPGSFAISGVAANLIRSGLLQAQQGSFALVGKDAGLISSAFNLVLNFESSALSAPQSLRDGVTAAAAILMQTILDPITVYIQVGYGAVNNGGSPLSPSQGGAFDGSGSLHSYPSVRSALISRAVSTTQNSFVSNLPNTTGLDGNNNFYLSPAIEKALGFVSPTLVQVDGFVGFGTGIPTNALVGVALHEITHALGREAGVGPIDFGRFSAVGTRQYGTLPPPSNHFSIDNGTTNLADYSTSGDLGDFLNGGVQSANDPFNGLYTPGSTFQTLTTVDKQILATMGFNVGPI